MFIASVWFVSLKIWGETLTDRLWPGDTQAAKDSQMCRFSIIWNYESQNLFLENIFEFVSLQVLFHLLIFHSFQCTMGKLTNWVESGQNNFSKFFCPNISHRAVWTPQESKKELRQKTANKTCCWFFLHLIIIVILIMITVIYRV